MAIAASGQPDPNTLAESARQAMAERRYADATRIYAELAERYPGETALQVNLGMALHFSGRNEEAIRPLQAASLALPASFPAQFALGASLARLGRHEGAIGPLRKATQLNPDHVPARALLAESLEAAGQTASAAAVWRSLANLERGNPFAQAGLARCHQTLATAAIEQLRNRAPESGYMLRILGHSRLADRQYASALYLFRTALERQPGVREVHEAVASVYEGAGHPDWARAERQKAASLPEPNCAAADSAMCNFLAGRFDLAPTLTEDSSLRELYWAARSHARLAEDSFQRLASLPQSAEQLTLVADVLAAQGHYSGAADACLRAIENGGPRGSLERELAELLYLGGRTGEALPLLERFHQSEPDDPGWTGMLGSALAAEQKYERAVPLLETALRNPEAPVTARLELGRSLLALDQPERALPHLQASLGLDEDGSLHYQLAQAFRRLGMRQEAGEALEQYRLLDSRKRKETEAGAALRITAPE